MTNYGFREDKVKYNVHQAYLQHMMITHIKHNFLNDRESEERN